MAPGLAKRHVSANCGLSGHIFGPQFFPKGGQKRLYVYSNVSEGFRCITSDPKDAYAAVRAGGLDALEMLAGLPVPGRASQGSEGWAYNVIDFDQSIHQLVVIHRPVLYLAEGPGRRHAFELMYVSFQGSRSQKLETQLPILLNNNSPACEFAWLILKYSKYRAREAVRKLKKSSAVQSDAIHSAASTSNPSALIESSTKGIMIAEQPRTRASERDSLCLPRTNTMYTT